MAEERYLIPANPVYDEHIRKLQDSDPADACRIFNPLFSRLIENIASVKRQADGTQEAASSIQTLEVTIPAEGWRPGPGEAGEPEGFCTDIPVAGAMAYMTPFLVLLPTALGTAGSCGFSPVTRTLDGLLRVYARRVPEQAMQAVVVLALPSVNGGGAMAGDGEVNEMLNEVFGRRE